MRARPGQHHQHHQHHHQTKQASMLQRVPSFSRSSDEQDAAAVVMRDNDDDDDDEYDDTGSGSSGVCSEAEDEELLLVSTAADRPRQPLHLGRRGRNQRRGSRGGRAHGRGPAGGGAIMQRLQKAVLLALVGAFVLYQLLWDHVYLWLVRACLASRTSAGCGCDPPALGCCRLVSSKLLLLFPSSNVPHN